MRGARGGNDALLLERGELAEAERVLALPGIGEEVPEYFGFAWFLSARGMLRLTQRKPHDARRDFETIGRMATAVDLQNPALRPWRSPAATALHALGRDAQARERAAEELELGPALRRAASGRASAADARHRQPAAPRASAGCAR